MALAGQVDLTPVMKTWLEEMFSGDFECEVQYRSPLCSDLMLLLVQIITQEGSHESSE